MKDRLWNRDIDWDKKTDGEEREIEMARGERTRKKSWKEVIWDILRY